jgi:hypothetical protein
MSTLEAPEGGVSGNVTLVLVVALVCPMPPQILVPTEGLPNVAPPDMSRKPRKLPLPASVSVLAAPEGMLPAVACGRRQRQSMRGVAGSAWRAPQ